MGRNNADFNWAADQARQRAENDAREERAMSRAKTTYNDDGTEDEDYPRDMERPQS
jgi:hypothetical protein